MPESMPANALHNNKKKQHISDCETRARETFADIHSLDGPAREEDDALALLVVEEIVERPQAARLAERIRVQVRIVAVDVAVVQVDLLVQRRPQGAAQRLVLVARNHRQIRVHRRHHVLQRRLLAELIGLPVWILRLGCCFFFFLFRQESGTAQINKTLTVFRPLPTHQIHQRPDRHL